MAVNGEEWIHDSCGWIVNEDQAYSSMDSHSGSARKRLWQALERSQYLPVLEGSTKMSIVVTVPEEFSIPAVDMFVAWWKWMRRVSGLS